MAKLILNDRPRGVAAMDIDMGNLFRSSNGALLLRISDGAVVLRPAGSWVGRLYTYEQLHELAEWFDVVDDLGPLEIE